MKMKMISDKLNALHKNIVSAINLICADIGNRDHDFSPANMVQVSSVGCRFNVSIPHPHPIEWVGKDVMLDKLGYRFDYSQCGPGILAEFLDALIDHIVNIEVGICADGIKLNYVDEITNSYVEKAARSISESMEDQYFPDFNENIEGLHEKVLNSLKKLLDNE